MNTHTLVFIPARLRTFSGLRAALPAFLSCLIASAPIHADGKTAEFIGVGPAAPFTDPGSWNDGIIPDANTDILLTSKTQLNIISKDPITVKSIKNISPDVVSRVYTCVSDLTVTGDIDVSTLFVTRRLICKGDIKVSKASNLGIVLELDSGTSKRDVALVVNKLSLLDQTGIVFQFSLPHFLNAVESWHQPLAELGSIEPQSPSKIILRTYPPNDTPFDFPNGEYPLLKIRSKQKPSFQSLEFSQDFSGPPNGSLEWRGDVLYLIVK